MCRGQLLPRLSETINYEFYSDVGSNYARIGRVELDAGGWVDGLETYYARFKDNRDNCFQARKSGARLVMLPRDIWETDHATQSSNWPGDNGNWTDYINHPDHLIIGLKDNDMLDGLVYDIWTSLTALCGNCHRHSIWISGPVPTAVSDKTRSQTVS